jgi:hypothetical protein
MADQSVLRGETVTLRPAPVDDVPRLAAIIDSPAVARGGARRSLPQTLVARR